MRKIWRTDEFNRTSQKAKTHPLRLCTLLLQRKKLLGQFVLHFLRQTRPKQNQLCKILVYKTSPEVQEIQEEKEGHSQKEIISTQLITY